MPWGVGPRSTDLRARAASSGGNVAHHALTSHIAVVWRAHGKGAEMAFDAPITAGRADAEWNPEAALRLVRLPALMQRTAGARNIAVGLIDGPIVLDHPDLVCENIRVLDQSAGGTCARPESTACTHGTYVAGILHAKRDSYVRGICPDCTLLVRSIFSEAAEVSANDGVPNATVGELAAALREVIEVGARVVNLSAGLAEAASHAEPTLDQVLELATRRGVMIVAAAGEPRHARQLGDHPPPLGHPRRRLRPPRTSPRTIKSRGLDRSPRSRRLGARYHQPRRIGRPRDIQRQQRRRPLRHGSDRTAVVGIPAGERRPAPPRHHRKRGASTFGNPAADGCIGRLCGAGANQEGSAFAS